MSTDLTQAYRSLDPLSPLEPGSDWYVARPDNPMERVLVDLKLSASPRHYLLVGHRGTGKTTELRRLAQSLEGERTLHYVDVGESTKLAFSEPGEILPRAFMKTEDQPLHVNVSLDEEFARFLDSRKGVGEPVILLFDGLERLERDEDVVKALTSSVPLHSWPVSVICTIPLSVYLSDALEDSLRKFDRSVFLAGIATSGPKGEAHDEGLISLMTIVRQRTGDDVFGPGALLLLSKYSAGIHRELLRLSQRACVIAALAGGGQVTVEHVRSAVVEQRNEYSVMLRDPDFDLLRFVHRTKQLPGGSGVARLIRNQLIVAYTNGVTWFDVHPVVEELIKEEDPAS